MIQKAAPKLYPIMPVETKHSTEKQINKKLALSQTASRIMTPELTASDMLHTKTKLIYEEETASVNIFLLEFWEQTFGCTWSPNDDTSQLCTGGENLEAADTLLTDVSLFRVSYNTYMAVYAIAKALHNLQYCVPMKSILLNITCGDILSFEPWQVRVMLYFTFFLCRMCCPSQPHLKGL